MNNQLIRKIIKTSDASDDTEITYENPLIDRKVAGALARSFVKILSVSQKDSNINNSLRYSVLANIRKLCQIQPEKHLEVDENYTKLITEVYANKCKEISSNDIIPSVYRNLDEFLARQLKEIDLSSNCQYSMKPEVIQSLANLNGNPHYLESLCKNILFLDTSDKKNLALVKNLWTNISLTEFSNSSKIYGDIAIKIKSEIEVILLNICYSILTEQNLQIEELFTCNEILNDLVKKSSKSPKCFQICSGILNSLFIHTSYNSDIGIFISNFIKNIKTFCLDSISMLYPAHLHFTVILLDINLDSFPEQFKETYIKKTLSLLKLLHENSDSDFILLLSHYPHWFDNYFS